MLDELQPVVHLRLHALPTEIITPQGIDLFADANELVAVVGKRLLDLSHVGLKFLQHFVQQFVSHLGHEVHSTRKTLRIPENMAAQNDPGCNHLYCLTKVVAEPHVVSGAVRFQVSERGPSMAPAGSCSTRS